MISEDTFPADQVFNRRVMIPNVLLELRIQIFGLSFTFYYVNGQVIRCNAVFNYISHYFIYVLMYSSISLSGSIAIVVPLVLLVTLITTLVIGLVLCKRKRRYGMMS